MRRVIDKFGEEWTIPDHPRPSQQPTFIDEVEPRGSRTKSTGTMTEEEREADEKLARDIEKS
jgi:hypothetical protein